MSLLNRHKYTMYPQDLEARICGNTPFRGRPRGSWVMVGMCRPAARAPMERPRMCAESGVCVLLAGVVTLHANGPRRLHVLCLPMRLSSTLCAFACVIVCIGRRRATWRFATVWDVLYMLWRRGTRVDCLLDDVLPLNCACDPVRMGMCCVIICVPSSSCPMSSYTS